MKTSAAHFQLVWWGRGWYPSVLAMGPQHKLGWWWSTLGLWLEILGKRHTPFPGVAKLLVPPGEVTTEEGRNRSGREKVVDTIFRLLESGCTGVELYLWTLQFTWAKRKSPFNLIWFELVSNSYHRKSPDERLDGQGNVPIRYYKDKIKPKKQQ